MNTVDFIAFTQTEHRSGVVTREAAITRIARHARISRKAAGELLDDDPGVLRYATTSGGAR